MGMTAFATGSGERLKYLSGVNASTAREVAARAEDPYLAGSFQDHITPPWTLISRKEPGLADAQGVPCHKDQRPSHAVNRIHRVLKRHGTRYPE